MRAREGLGALGRGRAQGRRRRRDEAGHAGPDAGQRVKEFLAATRRLAQAALRG